MIKGECEAHEYVIQPEFFFYFCKLINPINPRMIYGNHKTTKLFMSKTTFCAEPIHLYNINMKLLIFIQKEIHTLFICCLTSAADKTASKISAQIYIF